VVIGIDYIQLSFDEDHDGPYSAISWREQVIIYDEVNITRPICCAKFQLLANKNNDQ
jgi:hypothetical protein